MNNHNSTSFGRQKSKIANQKFGHPSQPNNDSPNQPINLSEHAMPSASAQIEAKEQHNALTTSQLQRLCKEASELVFTNFEAARGCLALIEKAVPNCSIPQIRLDFHRASAFLENQFNHPDKAIFHLGKAIEILKALADPLPLADAWLDLAAIHTNLRDREKAESALKMAEKLVVLNPDSRILARFATREGFYYLFVGQDKNALANLMDAERHFLSLGDSPDLKDQYLLTLTLSGLGELYRHFDDKEKSVSAFLRVLQICEKYRLRPRLAWHYLNAGNARLAQNDPLGADEFFQAALRFADESETGLKAKIYANLGINAFLAEDFEQAIELLTSGGELFKNPKGAEDFRNLTIMNLWLARANSEIKAWPEAEIFLEKASKTSENSGDPQLQAEVCTAFADFRAAFGRFDLAFELQKKAAAFSAIHVSQTHDREIREMEARHEIEIGRQEKRNAELRLTSLQLKALRAQMNPHFLFNALNAIQGMVTSGRTDEAELYIVRFSKLMRRTLDYSDWEVVALETEIEFLENYLGLNAQLRFQGKFTYIIEVSDEIEADDFSIPTMVVQPFVENAIEHGLKPKQGGTLRIFFDLSEDENFIVCKIEDDGIGFRRSQEMKAKDKKFTKHRSRGMEITSDRLVLLHQQKGFPGDKFLKINDLEETTQGIQTGTLVEILIPIMEG